MTDESKPNESESGSADAGKDEGPKNLESLLASWDDSGKGKDKPPAGDDAILTEIADLRLQMELPKYVDVVKGDTGISDKMATGLISEAIRTDERFSELWDNRHRNKGQFEDALKAINKEVQTDLGQAKGKNVNDAPDDQLAAAVRSARESGEGAGSKLDGVDWSGISDAELAIKKQEVFRLQKAGQLK